MPIRLSIPKLAASVVTPTNAIQMEERIGLVEGRAADQTFLGQPIWVAQRCADSRMPVTREGRYAYASPEELNRWLGRESAGGLPVRNSPGVSRTSVNRADSD